MWSKIYVSILVILILIVLQSIGHGISTIDTKYSVQEKYGMPIRCMSTAICGISGNIFLLWVIYLIIPDIYYEDVLSLLNPQMFHKSADKDVLGINKYI